MLACTKPRTAAATGACSVDMIGNGERVHRLGDDLVGADLSGADLSGADLRGRDLRGAKLDRADLSSAALSGANLDGSSLREANLDDANLIACSMRDADLTGSTAHNANFGQADLTGASAFSVDFENASLTGAILVTSDLRTSVLTRARLIGANLRGADLTGSMLIDSDLTGADVSGAAFGNADLAGSRLHGVVGYSRADWIHARAELANFSGALLARRTVMDQNYLHEFRTKDQRHDLIYRVWRLSSNCGQSFVRWGLLTAAVALVFAAVFTTVDIDYGDHETALSPLYFSVVTLTTLGFGDVLPASIGAQVAVILEVILG